MSDDFAPNAVLPEPEDGASDAGTLPVEIEPNMTFPTNEEGEDEAIEQANAAGDEDPLAGVDIASDTNLPDATKVVTLRTSGGDTRYVPTDGSDTVGALIQKAGLSMPAGFQVWYNGAQLDMNAVVPAGSTLTILGSVKGGTR